MTDEDEGGPSSAAALIAAALVTPRLLAKIAEDPAGFGYPSLTSAELLELAMYLELGPMDTGLSIRSHGEAIIAVSSIAERMEQDSTHGGVEPGRA